MYKFGYFYLLSVFVAFSAQAQEIDLRQKVQEVINTPQIQELLSGGFKVSDVNNDGFISENEFSYIVTSVDSDITLTAAQKAAKKQRLQEYFKQADANKDNKLDKDEYITFMEKESEVAARERAEKIKEMAQKSPEEMMKDFNEQMAKTKAALDDLQKISPEERTNNFLEGLSTNMAEENYFQMDKDKDGCVTEDEYVDYMIVFAKNSATDTESIDTNLSAEDWRGVYRDAEEKAKENCLTKEEYIRNFKQMPDLSDIPDVSEFENETDEPKE